MHSPSHEVWSYERDGRWWGWSFVRGFTVHWFRKKTRISWGTFDLRNWECERVKHVYGYQDDCMLNTMNTSHTCVQVKDAHNTDICLPDYLRWETTGRNKAQTEEGVTIPKRMNYCYRQWWAIGQVVAHSCDRPAWNDCGSMGGSGSPVWGSLLESAGMPAASCSSVSSYFYVFTCLRTAACWLCCAEAVRPIQVYPGGARCSGTLTQACKWISGACSGSVHARTHARTHKHTLKHLPT